VNGIPQEVSVSMEDILPHIQLVDYVTGEVPQKAATAGSGPLRRMNLNALACARLDDPQSRAADSLVFYVSCNSGALDASKSIAVSVTLADGRVISTASNASAGFNSAVTLTLWRPLTTATLPAFGWFRAHWSPFLIVCPGLNI
jgi:hypothetical protein